MPFTFNVWIFNDNDNQIWVRPWNFGCFVTGFCYEMIAKPGYKTAATSSPYPCTILLRGGRIATGVIYWPVMCKQKNRSLLIMIIQVSIFVLNSMVHEKMWYTYFDVKSICQY